MYRILNCEDYERLVQTKEGIEVVKVSRLAVEYWSTSCRGSQRKNEGKGESGNLLDPQSSRATLLSNDLPR